MRRNPKPIVALHADAGEPTHIGVPQGHRCGRGLSDHDFATGDHYSLAGDRRGAGRRKP